MIVCQSLGTTIHVYLPFRDDKNSSQLATYDNGNDEQIKLDPTSQPKIYQSSANIQSTSLFLDSIMSKLTISFVVTMTSA